MSNTARRAGVLAAAVAALLSPTILDTAAAESPSSPAPVFTDQTDCTNLGSYQIPASLGISYRVDGTGQPAGTYPLALNSQQTITITAADGTGAAAGTWTHTYPITIHTGCYQPSTVTVHASSQCGGPVTLTGAVSPAGLPTPVLIVDIPADGMPFLPGEPHTLQPGAPFRFDFYLPTADRPAGLDQVQMWLVSENLAPGTSDILASVTAAAACPSTTPTPSPTHRPTPAPSPAGKTVQRLGTALSLTSSPARPAVLAARTTNRPTLANTGTPDWLLAAVAFGLIGLGWLLTAGPRRA